MIKPEKLQELFKRLSKLGVKEEELVVKYILGSGPGGQKVNKSHSTVYLKHLPTAIEVKCQRTRSRTLNHYYAHLLLCEKLEKQLLGIQTAKEQAAAKIRRQKKRRSRRSKEKILEEKRAHAEKKQLRRSDA